MSLLALIKNVKPYFYVEFDKRAGVFYQNIKTGTLNTNYFISIESLNKDSPLLVLFT
jgi:hypothetical protein